jgi:hypothetical protein
MCFLELNASRDQRNSIPPPQLLLGWLRWETSGHTLTLGRSTPTPSMRGFFWLLVVGIFGLIACVGDRGACVPRDQRERCCPFSS